MSKTLFKYSYIQDFIDHLEDDKSQQLKLPFEKRDIFAPCTNAQMAMNCMIDCFLGEDWYVSYPACAEQVNTEACFEILYKYSRKFRKYVKKQRKHAKSKRK